MAWILTTSKRPSCKLGDVFVIGIDRRRAFDRNRDDLVVEFRLRARRRRSPLAGRNSLGLASRKLHGGPLIERRNAKCLLDDRMRSNSGPPLDRGPGT
jgi:hypothetical protein